MKEILIILLLSVILTSCEFDELDEGPRDPIVYHEIKRLDGVKLISPAITKANKSSTYSQSIYRLDSNRRLLIRFESLQDHSDSILVTDENRIFLELTPAEDSVVDDPSLADSLQLCPLTKNWMMLATWYQAHPFMGGSWDYDGGDYNAAECVRGESAATFFTGDDDYNSEANRILFDVTNWTTDYLKATGHNYGWVILSEGPIAIYGDASSLNYPRIVWKRWE